VLTPARIKRALGIAEPFLPLAVEAVGAGIPELLVVLGGVAVAKHILSQGSPAGPEPTHAMDGHGPALSAA
jgi:hypothetical protein